jgi:hypothetical protein
MRKKRHILLMAIVVALLCGLVYWLISPGQPMPYYNGKSLEYWIVQYQQNGSGTGANIDKMQQAQESIQKIGTNALPTLLRMTAANGSPALEKLKWGINNQRVVRLHLRLHTAFEDHWMSSFGFLALGSSASPATPNLIVLLSHKNPEVRVAAIRALGNIGPAAEAAVPALIKCLEDREWVVRHSSANSLGMIGRRPEMVVPVLIRKLDESHRATNIYQPVMYTLAVYKDYPLTRTAVPRLIQFINDQDYYCRWAATQALLDIDPMAAAKLGVK